MSANSSIEWTEATWNPVVGCTRVSAGCDSCYAVTMTHRLQEMGQAKYAGLTVLNKSGERHFNGQVRCVEDALSIPLGWRKPRTIFVNSMSDLFHRDVPFDFIDRVLAVMALCPQHTFQVLTKRPERMAEYLLTGGGIGKNYNERETHIGLAAMGMVFDAHAADRSSTLGRNVSLHRDGEPVNWPLPNVWLGTSCEDQRAADARIPHLLRCPAAVRGLSLEPLLGPIRLERYLWKTVCLRPDSPDGPAEHDNVPAGDIHWVIIGGESGPCHRPCEVGWIESIVSQCRAAGVPVFVKQDSGPKPGRQGRIPDALWVKQFPAPPHA